MNRGNAGVIGTLVTPSASVATGVFSLNQLQVAAKNGTWPPFAVSDPYFNYVTMLLPGNGTNGAQNNTFLDSSTNNFAITRIGNTTQGTFAPYGNLWSNFFDGGSTNLLSFPSSSTAYNLSGAAWTVQFWVYPLITTFSDGACRVLMAGANGTNTAWVISIEPNYSLTFSIPFGGTTNIATASGALTRNTWTHVAVVYSGGTARIYFNGVSVAGPVAITLPVSSTVSFKIGYDNVGTVSTRFNGYISNVAINITTALYTSAFTPPTIPLTAVSGTSLLTCQSNRFIDNSTNALAITVAGNPSTQRFSPFLPTASYAPSVDGGSGYFDGSGDYLSLAGNTAFTMPGNFTAEAWVYCNGYTNDFAAIFGFSSDSESTGWNILVRTNGKLHFNVAMTFTDATGTLPLNQWTHVALVRSGSGSGNVKLYVNGVADATTLTVNATATSPSTVMLGSYPGITSRAFNGYISNARIVKGTAVYTANFTPPTAPLTAITNTSLLTNFTNAGIIDNAEMNNLETVGNAQISTAQSKWDSGSIAFDGTGDWLQIPPNVPTVLGTGDFTIEFWARFSGFYNFITIVSSTRGANGFRFNIGSQASAQIVWYANGAERVRGTTSMLPDVWYHIAFVRYNGVLKGYLNGVQDGTTYTDSINYSTPVIRIGNLETGGEEFNGFMDDLRITRGYARYTANFTPPTAAFPTL
jgi:hypothetical protein